MVIEWLKQRCEAARLAQSDAEALIFKRGERALEEAFRRQRAGLVIGYRQTDPRNPAHWRRVAQIIAEQSRN